MSESESSETKWSIISFFKAIGIVVGTLTTIVTLAVTVHRGQKELAGSNDAAPRAPTPIVVVTGSGVASSNVLVVNPTAAASLPDVPAPGAQPPVVVVKPSPVTVEKPKQPRIMRNEVIVPKFESTDQVEYLESEGKGEGSTRGFAMAQAISEALSKRLGAEISDRAVLSLQSETTEIDDKSFSRVDQGLVSRYESASGGLLKWWDIKSETEDAGQFVVEVAAVVARIKPPSGPRSKEKVLAILPLRVDEDVSINGRIVKAGVIGAQFRESLMTYLANARRFSILDQTFSSELDGLAGERPGQDLIQRATDAAKKLGAQYAVVGLVNGMVVGRRMLGGLEVSTVDGLVNLRIIEIASRRTVLASAFKLDELENLELKGSRPENSIADSLGRAMSRRTLETIYPYRVAALSGAEEVTIDRGGDDLAVGDRFDVCNPGEQITDETTGESRGMAERKVATVEIVRVNPKNSTARVVKRTGDIVVEAICRKSQSKEETTKKPRSITKEIDNLFK